MANDVENHSDRWRTILAAGLLLALPLVFSRAFARQFTEPKVVLAEGLVALGLIGVAWEIFRGRMPTLAGNPLVLPLCALAAAVLVSCLASSEPVFSLFHAAYFLCGPLWFLLLVTGRRNEARLRTLAVLAAVAGTAVSAIALFQWLGHDPLAFGGYHADLAGLSSRMRLYSTFGNPNLMSGYLIATFFLEVALAVLAGSRAARLGWALAAAVMLGAILGSFSLGAWAAWAAGACIAAIVMGLRRAPAKLEHPRPAGMTLSGFAFPVAVVMLAGAWDFALSRLAGRFYLWRASWPMFSSHPLTGSGWGTFDLHFLDLQAQFLAAHPGYAYRWTNARFLHNDPLQLLMETGLVGFAAFVWLGVAYALQVKRALARGVTRSERIWLAASAGAATALLADSFVNFQFSVAPTFFLLFALLAFPSLLGRSQTEAAAVKASPLARAMTTVLATFVAALLLVAASRRAAADWQYATGLAAESRGEPSLAAEAYRRGVKFNPLEGLLHFGLARALYLQGDYNQSLGEVKLAERTYRDSHLEVLKARVEDAMGLSRLALATYRHALYLDPTLTTVQSDIGRLTR